MMLALFCFYLCFWGGVWVGYILVTLFDINVTRVYSYVEMYSWFHTGLLNVYLVNHIFTVIILSRIRD